MNSDIARRAHAVLTRALGLDGRERDEFIATQCADDPLLRSQVARLLTAVSKSGVFLETPAMQTGRSAERPPSALPEQIGGYRIVRVLGAGGMATVYEAEQQQPRRTVALKVMRLALSQTSARQRFHFETAVLARLRHPGIAQIYEAGTFEESAGVSLPFFAMEFVANAKTITEFARSHQLGLHERLRLFLEVCDAVQHGHQLGIIHRDIKPGNILVSDEAPAGRSNAGATRHSGVQPEQRSDAGWTSADEATSVASSPTGCVALPKIIDFGVARSVDPNQAGITRDSDLGRLVGTLHYMSPEQCSESASVDIRCDVYALGVVLYELVGGRLPHELSQTPLPEAIRVIMHDSPPPLGRIVPEARGDIEAIVGMAMEKEPRRRYASVAALAADVRRYLADQPIDARPATTLTHLRKFARRNRAVVAGVAGVFITLVGGIVATTYMALIADDSRRAAELRERELEQVTAFQHAQLSQIDPQSMGRRLRDSLAQAVADTAGDPAAAERARGEFERLLGEINFTTLALRALDENLLERSHQAINAQFAGQPVVRAQLLQRLAQTMSELGLAQRGLPVCEEALQIRRTILGPDHVDTMQSEHLRGNLLSALSRNDEAIAVLRDLLERSLRTLGGESDKTLTIATGLGGALRLSGDLDGAERIWRDTLNTQRRVVGPDHPSALITLNNLGIIHALRGQLPQAEACWREVLERRRALGVSQAELSKPRTNLGLILQEQGRLAEVRPLFEEELQELRARSGDDHPDTLGAMLNLASLLLETQELEAAEALQRECLERCRRVFGPEHHKTVQAMGALGAILLKAGQLEEAERLLRDALARQRRKPGANHPDTIETLRYLSELLCGRGQTAEAESLAGEALRNARQASDGAHPTLADCLVAHGQALAAAQRWDEAEAALTEAVAVASQVRGLDHPKTHAAQQALAAVRQGRRAPD